MNPSLAQRFAHLRLRHASKWWRSHRLDGRAAAGGGLCAPSIQDGPALLFDRHRNVCKPSTRPQARRPLYLQRPDSAPAQPPLDRTVIAQRQRELDEARRWMLRPLLHPCPAPVLRAQRQPARTNRSQPCLRRLCCISLRVVSITFLPLSSPQARRRALQRARPASAPRSERVQVSVAPKVQVVRAGR